MFADVIPGPVTRIIMLKWQRAPEKVPKNDHHSTLRSPVDSFSETSEYDSVPSKSL